MSRLREEWIVLLFAIQFLTRIPISLSDRYTPKRVSAGVRYYPLVGLLIGMFAAGTYIFASLAWSPLIAVLVSTAATALLTGGFHEDGLADTFDGIGGGLERSDALRIMKDSRIGVYGALALFFTLFLKIALLLELSIVSIAIVLLGGHCLSRLSSVLVIATSAYARDEGTGKPTADAVNGTGLVVAIATGLACLFFVSQILGMTVAVAALIGLAAGHVAIRLYFERKIGGYTGDCLGATQQVSEVGIYLGMLWCL